MDSLGNVSATTLPTDAIESTIAVRRNRSRSAKLEVNLLVMPDILSCGRVSPKPARARTYLTWRIFDEVSGKQPAASFVAAIGM